MDLADFAKNSLMSLLTSAGLYNQNVPGHQFSTASASNAPKGVTQLLVSQGKVNQD